MNNMPSQLYILAYEVLIKFGGKNLVLVHNYQCGCSMQMFMYYDFMDGHDIHANYLLNQNTSYDLTYCLNNTS